MTLTGQLPTTLGVGGYYPEHSHWNTDTKTGLIGQRHYTDHKTFAGSPILQEMSHMVLMVAPARPTPVMRLVHWFVICMTGRYFAGCETQTSQTKTIPQPRVSIGEDHTNISL